MKLENAYPHAVAKLRAERKARSTRPFLARGSQVKRCERCRISLNFCICALQPTSQTQVGVCLLMYDTEPLKPSNTGWLIADVVKDTYAFNWSRVGDMQAVIDLIEDPKWQPYVVFPESYADPMRVRKSVKLEGSKRPLFILLDATWTEARKIFRKSPYLDSLPILSLEVDEPSNYLLRHSDNAQHLCTAEVAVHCLHLVGEEKGAKILSDWLSVFTSHYLLSKKN